MSDSTPLLQQITEGANAATRVNEVNSALSPAALYGRNAQTASGLTWGYYGGYFNGIEVANGTVALTASNTNYVVANRSTGVVSASITTTNWVDTLAYMQLYQVVSGASTVTSYKDRRQNIGGEAGGSAVAQSIIIACGDEVTDLTAGAAKVTFRMPYAFTLSAVRASVTSAPTGSVLRVDINEAGTSILSTKLTIDATEKSSTTAFAPPVISDTSLADDAEITIDIDAVGSTLPGIGLKVCLIGVPT